MLTRPMTILLAVLLCAAVSAAANTKPYILLIVADAISCQHVGCYGSDWIDTPSINALARSGVKFNNAFAAAPGCSLSRAALLLLRDHNHAAALG